MNNWKIVGYISLGCSSVLLIYMLIKFLGILSSLSQNPILAPTASSVAITAIAPDLVLTGFALVVGFVGCYAGQEKSEMEEETDTDILNDRIVRLERIVDKKFTVITGRLDEIEEIQNMYSQKKKGNE